MKTRSEKETMRETHRLNHLKRERDTPRRETCSFSGLFFFHLLFDEDSICFSFFSIFFHPAFFSCCCRLCWLLVFVCLLFMYTCVFIAMLMPFSLTVLWHFRFCQQQSYLHLLEWHQIRSPKQYTKRIQYSIVSSCCCSSGTTVQADNRVSLDTQYSLSCNNNSYIVKS